MATHFLPLSKKCLAHYTPRQTLFHENWWKTEEVVRDARFFPNFCHISLPWQHTFSTVKKCVLHIYTPSKSVPNFMRIWKTEEVVVPHFLICRYHGNTLSTTVKKCACTYTPRQTSSFHENWWKTEEVVRDGFFPNMPLPWQHTFYHCILYPKAVPNFIWKTGSSSRRKIFPPFLP